MGSKRINFIKENHSMKSIIIVSIFSALAANVFSQTIKQNIDKQLKDKTTMDKAAKADVLIQKKTVTDSTINQKQVLKTGDKQIFSKRSHHRKKGRKSTPKTGPA